MGKLLSRSNKALRDGIQLSEAITGDGAAVFRHACWMDLTLVWLVFLLFEKAAAVFLEPATAAKRWSRRIPCLRRRTCAHHAPRL